ncbi:MAG: hypothetical protein ABSB09_02095 [Acidimicrobiales bacterium]|jgi:hypothetical protein
MAIAEAAVGPSPDHRVDGARREVARRPRDLQRTFQLLLATVWLLDAVLQIQPFMFTKGSNGFSGMLNGLASGNPGWVAHTITWNGSIVYHQPILTNTAFALIQFVIAFGITSKRTVKPALALSIVWAVGVWWFGEGAGAVFQGRATPFGGGPGGVLFYAVLAVLLWPGEGSDRPFVAARTVGVAAARWIWVAVWGVLAVLALVGSGRSPMALHDLVAGLNSGQPGWLARIDRASESFFLHHGTTAAVLLAVMCVVVAAGVFLPPRATKVTLVLAITVFAVIWVAVQDFGGILAGGATDPNSGLLVILLALTYWPQEGIRSTPTAGVTFPTVAAGEA